MFCDCVRVGCCATGVIENRYANVKGSVFDYFQLFGDMTVKGTWLPGNDDELRRPHAEYSPRWKINVFNLSTVMGPYDVVAWNIGHHSCNSAKVLDSVHIALHGLAARVVFVSTIGRNACKTKPSAGNIFNTGMFRFNETRNYWDGKTHLNGLENLKLATGFWNYLRAGGERGPDA